MYPPPPCESHGKIPTFDGNRTSCGTIRGASSKSEARGQNGARGIQRSGNKKGERKGHSTFESQTPNHQKYLMVLDNQKMEPPNSIVPKVAETTPPVVLTPPRLSQGGGGYNCVGYADASWPRNTLIDTAAVRTRAAMTLVPCGNHTANAGCCARDPASQGRSRTQKWGFGVCASGGGGHRIVEGTCLLSSWTLM